MVAAIVNANNAMQFPKLVFETEDGCVATITALQARPMRSISSAFGWVIGNLDKCFQALTAV